MSIARKVEAFVYDEGNFNALLEIGLVAGVLSVAAERRGHRILSTVCVGLGALGVGAALGQELLPDDTLFSINNLPS